MALKRTVGASMEPQASNGLFLVIMTGFFELFRRIVSGVLNALVGLPGVIGRSVYESKPFNSFIGRFFPDPPPRGRGRAVLCTAVALATLGGCSTPAPKEPYLFAGAYVHHETVELGRRVYVRNCQACHGERGVGRGPSSPGLNPQPRDLTEGVFRFAAIPPGYDLPRDEELMRVLDHGLQGTSMLAPDLQPTEKLAVLQFIKTFSPAWGDASKKVAPAQAPPNDPYGPKSDVGIAAGERAYHGKAMCWSCHPAYVSEDEIRSFQISYGQDPTAEFRENLNRSIKMSPIPPDYTWDGVKISTNPEAVHRTLLNGLLGGGMPAYGGILEDEELWAVAHYVNALVEGDLKSSFQKSEVKANEVEVAPDEPSAADEKVESTVSTDPEPELESIRSPMELLTNYSCLSCHSIDAATPGVGPSLFDVALRLNRDQILESITDPDAQISAGFEGLSALMTSSLNGNRFYKDVSEAELEALVDYLNEKDASK